MYVHGKPLQPSLEIRDKQSINYGRNKFYRPRGVGDERIKFNVVGTSTAFRRRRRTGDGDWDDLKSRI